MLKDEIRVRVTKFERKLSRACFFEVREIIAHKSVSQCVTWPLLNTRCSPCAFQQFAVIRRRNRAARFRIRLQPQQKTRLNFHEASPGTFSFARSDFD